MNPIIISTTIITIPRFEKTSFTTTLYGFLITFSSTFYNKTSKILFIKFSFIQKTITLKTTSAIPPLIPIMKLLE